MFFMCLSGSFSHSNFFFFFATGQQTDLKNKHFFFKEDIHDYCMIRFSSVTCQEHTGLDCEATPGLAWIPSPHCLCQAQLWVQIFRWELIPRWALGLQHPQFSPWAPPRGSAPAGMSGPSCSHFRTLLYQKM